MHFHPEPSSTASAAAWRRCVWSEPTCRRWHLAGTRIRCCGSLLHQGRRESVSGFHPLNVFGIRDWVLLLFVCSSRSSIRPYLFNIGLGHEQHAVHPSIVLVWCCSLVGVSVAIGIVVVVVVVLIVGFAAAKGRRRRSRVFFHELNGARGQEPNVADSNVFRVGVVVLLFRLHQRRLHPSRHGRASLVLERHGPPIGRAAAAGVDRHDLDQQFFWRLLLFHFPVRHAVENVRQEQQRHAIFDVGIAIGVDVVVRLKHGTLLGPAPVRGTRRSRQAQSAVRRRPRGGDKDRRRQGSSGGGGRRIGSSSSSDAILLLMSVGVVFWIV